MVEENNKKSPFHCSYGKIEIVPWFMQIVFSPVWTDNEDEPTYGFVEE